MNSITGSNAECRKLLYLKESSLCVYVCFPVTFVFLQVFLLLWGNFVTSYHVIFIFLYSLAFNVNRIWQDTPFMSQWTFSVVLTCSIKFLTLLGTVEHVNNCIFTLWNTHQVHFTFCVFSVLWQCLWNAISDNSGW